MKKFLYLLAVVAAFVIGYYFGTVSSPPDYHIETASVQSVGASVHVLSTNTPKPKNEYVLNTSTKKFHKPSCASVRQMKDSNKKVVTWSREEIINKGYDPCGRCHP